MKVKVQTAASFIDRVEAVRRQIAERAYELCVGARGNGRESDRER